MTHESRKSDDAAQVKRMKIHDELVKAGNEPNFKRLTPALLKNIFSLVDKHFYGYYILDTLKARGEGLKCGVYNDDDSDYIDFNTHITKDANGKIQHHVDVNNYRFNTKGDEVFELPVMLDRDEYDGDKDDKLLALQHIVENASIVVCMDLFFEVNNDRDRPYDLYGEERKNMCDMIFENCYFYGMHRKVKSRREKIWFEYKGKIIEGRIKEYVKDEPYTLIVAKNDKVYKVKNEMIIPKETDEYYVDAANQEKK